jgi:hypothetical protein
VLQRGRRADHQDGGLPASQPKDGRVCGRLQGAAGVTVIRVGLQVWLRVLSHCLVVSIPGTKCLVATCASPAFLRMPREIQLRPFTHPPHPTFPQGSKVFCLQFASMQTIDVPQSASMFRCGAGAGGAGKDRLGRLRPLKDACGRGCSGKRHVRRTAAFYPACGLFINPVDACTRRTNPPGPAPLPPPPQVPGSEGLGGSVPHRLPGGHRRRLARARARGAAGVWRVARNARCDAYRGDSLGRRRRGPLQLAREC